MPRVNTKDKWLDDNQDILNPFYKPRKKRAYQRKFLDDAETEPNPKYVKRKHAKKKSLFESGTFIALDGEGGEIDGRHEYLMMMAKHGDDEPRSVFNPRGLSSVQCFEFLIDLKRQYPKGIFVIFAGGYDGNLWLRDIDKETIEKIVSAKFDQWIEWGDWAIRFKQRKIFVLAHNHFRDKKGNRISVQVYDVHGFFQSSFVSACKQWIPSYPDLPLIVEGKKLRTAFTVDNKDFMMRYTTAELDALIMIMDKLREACKTLGLTLTRWDGAGAIAAAIYKMHDVKQYYQDFDDDAGLEVMRHAVSCAYFGGRIEVCKIGKHEGKIYHYDINSAYPSKQVDLPALKGGHWIPGKIAPYDFVGDYKNKLMLLKVRWSLPESEPICPFPLRSELQNKVIYPCDGIGWYWKPEVEAAQRAALTRNDWHIEVLDSFTFIPATDVKPFAWIGEYYKQRQEIVAESKRTGIPNGVEKAIKLGINSLYGKLAQRVGYDPEKPDRIPPYHNLCYAGFITSATRAQLFSAAMQSPRSIICMATDGIYSTTPLTLDCPKEKILGAWEYQQHDMMTVIQSGVYFLRDGETLSNFSRGFDKMTEQNDMRETLEKILTAWKNGHEEIVLPCTRFITLKTALIGGDWWDKWLSWHEFKQPDGQSGRKLAITPEGTKRRYDTALQKRAIKPHKNMIQTLPELNYFPDVESAPHNIPWWQASAYSFDLNIENCIESVD